MDEFTYYQSMTAQLAFPILTSIIIIIGCRMFSSDWETSSLSLVLKLIFLCFPACSAATLKIFVCREIHGVMYVAADYRLTCSGDEYAFYAKIASLGFLIYPIGCPLLYLILLLRNNHKIQKDAKCQAQFGFIYSRYQPQNYLWEISEMVRKFLLTGVILFLAPGSIAQLAMALLIASYFMAWHVRRDPFKASFENTLQTVSLVSTVMVLVLGIMIKASTMASQMNQANADNEKYNDPPPMLLVFICAATAILATFLAVVKTRKKLNGMVKKYKKYLAMTTGAFAFLSWIYCTSSDEEVNEEDPAPSAIVEEAGEQPRP